MIDENVNLLKQQFHSIGIKEEKQQKDILSFFYTLGTIIYNNGYEEKN